MNTEALLRRHFAAAAVQVEVSGTPFEEIVGEVRRNRMWFSIGAVAAALLVVVAVAGLMMRSPDGPIGPATTITPPTTPIVTETTTTTTTEPRETTTTAAPVTTTAVPENVVIAWSAADAERDVENYLAALAAGAYEQAAWPMENNGVAFDGQEPGETPAQYLERVCAGGVCGGPYAVAADGPGIVNEVSQASSAVTVTAVGSGDTAQFSVFTFEGQRIVSGVPPVAAGGEPDLVDRLFGDDTPGRVVVQRFDAFEIWENGQSEWITNWWADQIRAIEGDYAVGWSTPVVGLLDPTPIVDVACGALMTRKETVLVFDQCQESGWVYTDLTTGSSVAPPIAYTPSEDGASAWFAERGGATLTGSGDAEGNLFPVEANGVDLSGDDNIGYLRISVDGSMVAYVDHRDPNAYSHFWSPVVVVKDIATGAELNRWVLDGPVLGLEFSGDWVVVWEGSDSVEDLVSGNPPQVAAVAINIDTGEINRVETRTRVFLPS